ncbi:MAG: sirohydrochlorin chelatase [Gemmobacter sp.]
MPDALLIAHGAPSDPAPQEAAMAALAGTVAARLPFGWRVRGTTLAAPGAVEAALAALDRPLVFPFFMAEGYFTRTLLPRRLRAAEAAALTQLPCFGQSPQLPALVARAALDACASARLAPQATTLLLAAHGSQVSRASADATRAMAATVARTAPFARIVTAFVEEHPLIRSAAIGLHPAICLPLFALRAGHVAEDVPQALGRAGFRGHLLPAIGEHPQVPALIAAALQQAVPATK